MIIALLLCLLLSAAPLFPQEGKIVFDHITIKNGLSDGRIDCILQDSHGFLWFGTQDGLNRYDGYNFTVFDHDIFDSTSISSNWIRCIVEDRFRNLWIGTEGGGLNLFDYESERFTRWTHQPGNSQSLNDNFVRTIFEDSNGILWIGARTGLTQFDRQKQVFNSVHIEPCNPNSPVFTENVTEFLEDSEYDLWIGTQDCIYRYDREKQSIEHLTFTNGAERIGTLFEDSYGDIWIGSRYNGLRKYDRSSRKFLRYQNDPSNPKSLSSDEIKDIFEDREENLWIGTMHGGLNLFNRVTGGFSHFKNDPRDPSSLSSNSVRSIYQDRTGVVWIGMDGSGIDFFVKNRQKFQVYGNRVSDPKDLSNNTILSIFEDTDGVLWIGTEGGGLTRFSRKNGTYAQFKTEKDRPYSLSSNQVTCIFEDSEGVLWIGTKEGLNKFHKDQGIFHRYYVKTTPITGNNFINVILEDKPGYLLLGTNSGLISFDKKSGEFTPLNFEQNSLLDNEVVVTLLIDTTGLLWIGYLRSGLVTYHPQTRAYLHYRSDADKSNSLSNNFVQYLYQDKAGRVWVATRKGLNRFQPTSQGFLRYTKADGLSSNVIVGILEDDGGNLWLSTTNGLSKFNTAEETFINYNVDDGLQGNQFWIRSCFKSRSGELFFGGNNGFNAFYPDHIEKLANPHIPPIVITNVKILNEPLNQSVYVYTSGRDTIHLAYNENQVSFEFAALDFTRPEKNQFAYMLEGFENNWIYAGTRRYANYTNLDPGRYKFRVKGTNNDGVWNEQGAVLTLIIPTPFWKTGWAYVLYGLLAIGLIYGVNAYILSLVRMKHDLKIERMEKEKVKEINQFKLQFFTDIAHEFKTPLTLIQAPLEEILNSVKKGVPFQDEFRLMYRNVKYLLRLMHQLLSFRRAEQGRMELKVSRGDLVQFVKEVFELFGESARKHHIEYRFSTLPEVIEGWFDWEKLEEILVNVIDNAFKYTPDSGRISVNLLDSHPLTAANPEVTIEVQDTGMGIGKDDMDHIFERFYHAREGHHPNQVSSGLGLALTKKLVELHHGRISVESLEDRGSLFQITLPLGKAHLKEEEILSSIAETLHFRSLMQFPVEEGSPAQEPEPDLASDDNRSETALILIIEDNTELRTYMQKTLARHYRIAEARDGQEGFEQARKLLPDIVISDVMMPNLNGFDLCRLLKNDIATSHIPIILLTAKTAIEYKIEGIETGADDYIEKPFHFRFLDARIKNILRSREKLRERYRRELILQPNEISVVSTDEKFLMKIREIVEEHVDDPNLEIKQLASEAGLSRTNLFLKLKALTGYSPGEYIRTIRLEKAAQLLRKTELTIGEIAYQVGFKYPKYFSTCYHHQYGVTPSEYREQNGKQPGVPA